MMDNYSKTFRMKKNFFLNIVGYGGFTVTELVLALAIMMVVMSAMTSLLIFLNRAYTTQNVAAGVQQVARAGIDLMTRNIRMAGLNPLNTNPIGIVEASSNKIRFQHDTNGSGAIEKGQVEDVAYLINSNNQLIRQKDGNSRSNRSLVDDVDALTFKYLDANDSETIVLDDIQTVVISITVREPTGKGQFLSRSYSTRVVCRNLCFR